MKDAYLKVGIITSAHGIRGEVKVFPTTDDPERYLDLDTVYYDKKGVKTPLHIGNVKFFKQFVILSFEEIKDRNEAELFRKTELFVTREDAVPCEEDEYFIADLLDLDVITDEGEALGVLYDVLQTAANDVYIIKGKDDKELLIPATKECILDVDFEKNQMIVHLLPGLR